MSFMWMSSHRGWLKRILFVVVLVIQADKMI